MAEKVVSLTSPLSHVMLVARSFALQLSTPWGPRRCAATAHVSAVREGQGVMRPFLNISLAGAVTAITPAAAIPKTRREGKKESVKITNRQS